MSGVKARLSCRKYPLVRFGTVVEERWGSSRREEELDEIRKESLKELLVQRNHRTGSASP